METTGSWNSEPAVERITFGLKMSTQSSTSTTLLPFKISRTGFSFSLTPKSRIACDGSMNVRPT